MVKPEIRLWYFCGQMKNRRSFHCGDFQFWWTVRGSNPRPRRCERRALPAELTAQISHFFIKKVMKNGFLRYSILRGKSRKSDCEIGKEPKPWDASAYGCEPNALPTELRARLYLVCINFSYLDCAICWNTWACVRVPLLSQLSYGPISRFAAANDIIP